MNGLQTRILDVFKSVKEIIDGHNLTYFAIGGTAIGAVRHQGFIPWDDDLDIAMPRSDYEKLMKILPEELPEYLELRTKGHSENYCLKFSKVIDKTTTIIEGNVKDFPDLDEGVFVDIFPVDLLPDNPWERTIHIAKLSVYNKIDLYTTLSTHTFKEPLKKMICGALQPLKWITPKQYFRNKYYKEVVKHNNCESGFFGYKWDYPAVAKIFIQNIWVEECVDFAFEDTTIKIPKKYDEFLENRFGDYMQLPPKDKQASHHGFVAIDFETPYREYRTKYNFTGK